MRLIGLSLGAALLAMGSAHAMDGDAEAGKTVFGKCQQCHIVESATHRIGPQLQNLFVRPIAAAEDDKGKVFNYSPAFKKFAEENESWTPEMLTEYLKNPRAYIKGNRMAFAGLKDDADIANVIAYLKTFSEEKTQ